MALIRNNPIVNVGSIYSLRLFFEVKGDACDDPQRVAAELPEDNCLRFFGCFLNYD